MAQQCARLQFPIPSDPTHPSIIFDDPNARRMFNLAEYVKDMATGDGGVLTDQHVEMVTLECERLGLDEARTNFVLGAQ